ncbi:hypothetical protein Taro_016910, partial [Colocasia esculenta]|nr:hypothetical protein [Colocasia esculenta]
MESHTTRPPQYARSHLNPTEVGTHRFTHKPQPMVKHELVRRRRHQSRTDYWFMMPVSNPDNKAQELPLSLAVTDERSNCRSTTTSQEQWRPTNHHNLQATHPTGSSLTPLGALAENTK